MTVIRIVEEGMPQPAGSFVYRRYKPETVVREIIEKHGDLKLALARNYIAFRKPVSEDVIFNVSKENALFSVATSVPALMPILAAPWAIGEFASDTAFLTMNQIRMAFMLAAAHDEVVGYREQKSEIASIVCRRIRLARDREGTHRCHTDGRRHRTEGRNRIRRNVCRWAVAREVLSYGAGNDSRAEEAGVP